MSEITVNGIKLYYEEHGQGDPILCMDGTSSSAMGHRLIRFSRASLQGSASWEQV